MIGRTTHGFLVSRNESEQKGTPARRRATTGKHGTRATGVHILWAERGRGRAVFGVWSVGRPLVWLRLRWAREVEQQTASWGCVGQGQGQGKGMWSGRPYVASLLRWMWPCGGPRGAHAIPAWVARGMGGWEGAACGQLKRFSEPCRATKIHCSLQPLAAGGSQTSFVSLIDLVRLVGVCSLSMYIHPSY